MEVTQYSEAMRYENIPWPLAITPSDKEMSIMVTSKIARPVYYCQECGKVIPIKKGRSCHPTPKRQYKYCSKVCSGTAVHRRHGTLRDGKVKPFKHSPISFVNCPVCGKLFASHKGRKTRCSKECDKKWSYSANPNKDIWNKTKRDKYIPKPVKEIHCKICNKVYSSNRFSVAYCSDECRDKSLREMKREENTKRRLRETCAYVEKVIRQRIYDRDGWICQICGKKVDITKLYPHPFSPSLDHIVPLANGGKHESKNVQCSHFRCNSLKRNIESNKQLRLL